MGTHITTLAPVRYPSQGSYVARPKPAVAGTLLIQSLIDSIEGLKNALAVQTPPQPPVHFVSSGLASMQQTQPQPVVVQRIQPAEPPTQEVTVKRSWLLEFFD